MLTACVGYLFIFWISLSLDFQDATTVQLWIQRFFCLLMMLVIIAGCLNYRNIQHLIPLCSNSHRLIRYLGILLLDAAMIMGLMILMVIVVTIF
jgi:hypothetical protein